MLKYRKGVFIVVFSGGEKRKYLLLKRKLHWHGWEFPKGGIEKNENLKDAVKRELKEETGLNARKIINMKVQGKFNYPKELKDWLGIKGMAWKLFAVEVKGKRKIKLDKLEHSGYKWLGFSKAYKKLSFSDKKKCLKVVDKFIKKEK